MQPKVIVYGHAACPGVGPMRGLLLSSNVAHDYVDIRKDAQGAERVRAINNGNESVPTLVFPDGSSLTEPSVDAVSAKLAQLGYRVGVTGWLIGNAWRLLTAAIVIFAILRFLEII